jgi:hypothetical protein
VSGDGLWLTSYRLPSVAGPRRITLAKLRWDWSLVNLDGDVIVNDLRAAPPLDPLAHPDFSVAHEAPETDHIRLFDVREREDGRLQIVFAEFESTGKSTEGAYRLATVDLATGRGATENACASGGKIEEETPLFEGQWVRPEGTSSYVAGAALSDDPTEIVAARWWNVVAGSARAGGVAEWSKAHAWKACIGATLSRVRIPLPPPW